jgi:NAD-dependent SIR2 family protein deacetylase
VLIDEIRCSECHREVEESTAIKERWGFWSDGCGELLPYCPECALREFARDASASGLVPLVVRGADQRTR